MPTLILNLTPFLILNLTPFLILNLTPFLKVRERQQEAERTLRDLQHKEKLEKSRLERDAAREAARKAEFDRVEMERIEAAANGFEPESPQVVKSECIQP